MESIWNPQRPKTLFLLVDTIPVVRATEGPGRLAVCLRVIHPDGEVGEVVMVAVVEGC